MLKDCSEDKEKLYVQGVHIFSNPWVNFHVLLGCLTDFTLDLVKSPHILTIFTKNQSLTHGMFDSSDVIKDIFTFKISQEKHFLSFHEYLKYHRNYVRQTVSDTQVWSFILLMSLWFSSPEINVVWHIDYSFLAVGGDFAHIDRTV